MEQLKTDAMNAVASNHSGCVVSAEIQESQRYDVMFRKVTGMHSILLICVPMCMCVGGSQAINLQPNTVKKLLFS